MLLPWGHTIFSICTCTQGTMSDFEAPPQPDTPCEPEKDVEPTPPAKAKRPRTPAQQEAFKKCRAALEESHKKKREMGVKAPKKVTALELREQEKRLMEKQEAFLDKMSKVETPAAPPPTPEQQRIQVQESGAETSDFEAPPLPKPKPRKPKKKAVKPPSDDDETPQPPPVQRMGPPPRGAIFFLE